MIKSFADGDTERLFHRERVRRFEAVERQAQRKLAILNRARELRDLSAFPGSRLEKLQGTKQEQYSIRINDRWRIRFSWSEGDAYEVAIVDYH